MQLSEPKFIFAIRNVSISPLHNKSLANNVAPCNIVAKPKRDKMKPQHDGLLSALTPELLPHLLPHYMFPAAQSTFLSPM